MTSRDEDLTRAIWWFAAVVWSLGMVAVGLSLCLIVGAW